MSARAVSLLTLLVLLGLAAVIAASYQGWGLESDTKAVAKSVREGSMGRRSSYGGPRYGK